MISILSAAALYEVYFVYRGARYHNTGCGKYMKTCKRQSTSGDGTLSESPSAAVSRFSVEDELNFFAE